MTDYRLKFLFTARADASLSKVVSATRRDMDQLGAAGKGLGKSLSSGAGLGKLNSQLAASGKNLSSAKSELAGFAKTEAKAGATNTMLARRIGQTQRSVSGYARSLRSGTRELRDNVFGTRREITALRQLRGEYSRAGKALGKYSRQRRGARAGGGLLRSGGGLGNVKALAAGVAGAGLTKAVLDADMAQFRLSTVINNKGVESRETALRLATLKAEEMAKGGVSSLGDAYAIQYALNSGGLNSKAARAAAPIASKVAIGTGGMSEQVGEVIAGTYNNLAGSLAGTDEEKFKRIGELLTKTQAKYQFRDFGQLGESMKYGSAAMASYNVKLSQGFMLLGRLNSAQLEGSMAGTAFTAMLRGLNKAQDKWNISLVRDQNNQLDLIETLRELDEATAHLDVDEKAAAFQKVFGDEGVRALSPLLKGLHELDKDLADVEEDSKGIIDRNFEEYLKHTTAQLKQLTGTMTKSGVKLGSTFLPIINSAIPQITEVVDSMGQWAAANPAVVKGLGAVGASLLALKAGSVVLKPVVGLVRGGAKLFGRKGGGLFGRRGKSGRRGRRSVLGGLLGAASGATPVQVVNWPTGGGLGDLLGLMGGGKSKGRAGRALGRFARKGILGKAGRFLGRAGARIGGIAASSGLLAKAGGFLSKGAGKLLGKSAGKLLGKSAGKIGLKAVGKGLLKKIPVVGLLAGLGFGVQRALSGDWTGALGEVASGAASMIPGVGTAASLAIDAGLAARDIARESEEQTTPPAEAPATPAPELAATPTPELAKYAGSNESTLNVNIKQTVNAPGADADSLKDVLSQGREELKRTIEDVVKQYFWSQQRTGLNNA